MFIIYTKEKRPQIKFTVNLTREEVTELMNDNLFLDYPELDKNDFIIVEQEDVFKYPLLDNGIIREMTREELIEIGIGISLEEGEVIKGNNIVKLEKPSQYHKWNGKEWTVDIEEVKERKREELKNIRDEKDNSDLEVDGDVFKIKKDDILKFYLIGIGLNMGLIKPNDKEDWVLADNTTKSFTNSQLINVIAKKGERERMLFRKFIELDEKLSEATTVEEIEAIRWE